MSFSGLTFRQDYFADPAGWRALVDLLQDTFHIDIGVLDGLGGMEPSSMPFGWFDADGALAANLSAFSMPMKVNGKLLKVAALQSGAVRPAYQSKGLYRDVMQKAFAWIDANDFDLAMLYTDKPAMYEPYGFKTVPVHKFTGPAPQPGPATPARALDMDRSADVTLLADLINSRAPASNVFSPLSHPAMFLVNAFWDRSITLTLLEAHGAVAAWRRSESGAFHLLDVAGPAIPSLAAILGALSQNPTAVECFFSPDRLDWAGAAVIDENRLPFMLRGDLSLLPPQPFALTPMADF